MNQCKDAIKMTLPKTQQIKKISKTPQPFTANEFVKTFKAISDHTRLRILHLLFHKELYVCEISKLLHLCNSTISSHLTILQNADYIIDEKDGRWVKYRINHHVANPAQENCSAC